MNDERGQRNSNDQTRARHSYRGGTSNSWICLAVDLAQYRSNFPEIESIFAQRFFDEGTQA